MIDFFRNVFSSEFVPRGHGFFWQPEILWLHLISDLVLALSYFSIPCVMYMVIRQRRDVGLKFISVVFGLFMICAGMSSVLGILTLWVPLYGMDGIVKALKAVFALLTAFSLVPALPRFLQRNKEPNMELKK